MGTEESPLLPVSGTAYYLKRSEFGKQWWWSMGHNGMPCPTINEAMLFVYDQIHCKKSISWKSQSHLLGRYLMKTKLWMSAHSMASRGGKQWDPTSGNATTSCRQKFKSRLAIAEFISLQLPGIFLQVTLDWNSLPDDDNILLRCVRWVELGRALQGNPEVWHLWASVFGFAGL
jgi:hypothetical protein